jgi:hypothetical protein
VVSARKVWRKGKATFTELTGQKERTFAVFLQSVEKFQLFSQREKKTQKVG